MFWFENFMDFYRLRIMLWIEKYEVYVLSLLQNDLVGISPLMVCLNKIKLMLVHK